MFNFLVNGLIIWKDGFVFSKVSTTSNKVKLTLNKIVKN